MPVYWQSKRLPTKHHPPVERSAYDIFNYRDGVLLRPTGYLPSFIDSLVEKELLDLEFLYGRDSAAGSEGRCAPPAQGGTSQ